MRKRRKRREELRWRGKVSSYIARKVRAGEVLHFSLIDPAKAGSLGSLRRVIKALKEAGTDAFLIGGSLGVSESDVDEIVKLVDEFDMPSILFPGNVSGISRFADAIFFMSLLNSDDPYFIIGAQVLGAPIVKRYGLEALPTAYLIIGYGGAAGYVGRARPIPFEKPELAIAYALAAEFLGMRYVYLEAGSGSPRPVPPEVVSAVSRSLENAYVIVGGGIRESEVALKICESGANIIVTGNIIEDRLDKALKIIEAIKKR